VERIDVSKSKDEGFTVTHAKAITWICTIAEPFPFGIGLHVLRLRKDEEEEEQEEKERTPTSRSGSTCMLWSCTVQAGHSVLYIQLRRIHVRHGARSAADAAESDITSSSSQKGLNVHFGIRRQAQ
jgi:hypothetical protein